MNGRNLSGATTIALLSLAGCATRQPPLPVETPPTPAIVQEAERIAPELRSTIVPGVIATPVPPQSVVVEPTRGDISLNFPNADVRLVAKAVLGDLLRVPYTVAPGVVAPVTLRTAGPVARSALLGVFETALRQSNLALVQVPGGYEIQTTAAAQGQGTVMSGAIGYGTEIVSLQFVNGEEVRKVIDSVMPGVVTAVDPTRNTLTIAGTTGQRASARDLLRQFDVNWLRAVSFALFVPQRTDARLIVPELDKLINAADAPTRGLVRIISMERLNGILAVSAQPQYLEDVRRWIDVLDREGESSQSRIYVYRVQNGRARDLARTLNSAFGNATSGGGADNAPFTDQNEPPRPTGNQTTPAPPGAPGQPAAGASASAPAADDDPESRGGQTARITADEVNNAVIVFGTPREYAVVEDALRKLDLPPQQVMIEAAITEVTLNDELRFGVQWNFQTGDANFRLTDNAGGNVARAAPGFSFFFGNNDIRATLNALENRTNVRVVSAPKVLVLNNQTAALQVGDQVPVQTQQQQSIIGDSPIINSIEYRDTGVILKVTPRVNAGGLVHLDIAQEVSDISNRTVSGTTSPVISTRRVSTTIVAQDGQVIALGGLFRDARSFGKDGLPFLSRIPILGSLLFGRTINRQDRTELIILLKPHVLRTVDDGRAVTEELRAKLRTLEPFRTQGKIP